VHNPWREDRAWDARDTGGDAPLPGVIDTIGNGFAALAIRPFVAFPLMLLDVCLLLLPRITLHPLSEWAARQLDGRGAGWNEFVAEIERLERFNAFDLAVVRIPLARLPALIPALSDEDRSSTGWDLAWSDMPIWSIGAAAVGIFAVGLLISAVYRSLVAEVARPVPACIDALSPARIGRLALDLFRWVLVVLGLITLIAMPVIVLTVAGALLGLESLAVAWVLILIPIAWGFVHFYFAIHALFLDRCGPLQALKASYRVVRRHFWQSIQFILLTFIVTTGLTYALTEMAADPYGVFLAIVLNAFVATGMIAAATFFYRDRARRLDLTSASPASGR
jgi:hypothetical protein